jgi:hypothetical protein
MKTVEADVIQTKRLFAANEDAAEQKLFRDKFDSLPFLFHHGISADPRFGMDCIKALALRIPQTVSLNGKIGVSKGWTQPSARSATIDEALSGLEHGGSWIILKKVHLDPQYGDLLSKCISEAGELVHRHLEQEIESRTMSLILSSPGQVTPYHVDGDCNFLFQIQGTKTIYVFDGRDRLVLSEMEEENFWGGDISAAKYREENQPKAWAFELKPGNGVHVPVIYPHWVKNDQAVSMSLSINFRFHGHKRADIYRANRYIRKFGLRPRPVGKSKAADSIKGNVVYGTRKVLNTLRGLRKRAA